MIKIQASNFPYRLDERRVSVNDEEIHFKHAVLATGCGPRMAFWTLTTP